MKKLSHCPICNFVVKEASQDKKTKVLTIHCHHCGAYQMDGKTAKDFRSKYFTFNADTQTGRDNYNENMKMFHDHIRNHHQDVISDELIAKKLPLLHRSRI